MGDDAVRRPPVRLLRVRPTGGAILLIIAAVATALVLVSLFGATRQSLGSVFATIVVAWLASAIIDVLDRRIPRGLAVVATVLALVVLGAGAWFSVVATLRTEVNRLRTSLPEAAETLERRYEAAADFRLAERVQSFVDNLEERFSTRRTVSSAANAALHYFVDGILMLFLVGYGRRFVSAGLNQISDPTRRARVAAVGGRATRRARAYLLITIAQVLVTTLVTSLVFFLLDLRAPFLLGAIVGLLGAIPYVGFVLGGLLPLLLAAADREGLVLTIVAAVVLALQLLEALVVRRRVDPRTVHVGPALMAIVALIGFDLYGLGGALYGSAALVFALAVLDAVKAEPAPADQAQPASV